MPFSGKIIVNIGEIIPYDSNPEVVKEKWIESIQKLTGFTYIKDEQSLDEQTNEGAM